jgi:hypothetical protein
MALQTLNTIKQWFRTGLKPTQTQFWDTWDSFRHKFDKIPVKEVDGLDELLLSKADKTILDNHIADKNAHASQVNTDWNSESGFSQLLNKPEFRTINGETILGTGDIIIEAGGDIPTLQQVLDTDNKANKGIILTSGSNTAQINPNYIFLDNNNATIQLSTALDRNSSNETIESGEIILGSANAATLQRQGDARIRRNPNSKGTTVFKLKETNDEEVYTLATTDDFKTINGESILGEGNLDIEPQGLKSVLDADPTASYGQSKATLMGDYGTSKYNEIIVSDETEKTGIYQLKNQLSFDHTVLDSNDIGNITLSEGNVILTRDKSNNQTVIDISDPVANTQLRFPAKSEEGKTYTIATTDDFKTINGESIVGSGDILINGGDGNIPTLQEVLDKDRNATNASINLLSEEGESQTTVHEGGLNISEKTESGFLITDINKLGISVSKDEETTFVNVLADELSLNKHLSGNPVKQGIVLNQESSGASTIKLPLTSDGNVKTLATTEDFKTINGETIVGEGDITIEGGGNQNLQSVVDLGGRVSKEGFNFLDILEGSSYDRHIWGSVNNGNNQGSSFAIWNNQSYFTNTSGNVDGRVGIYEGKAQMTRTRSGGGSSNTVTMEFDAVNPTYDATVLIPVPKTWGTYRLTLADDFKTINGESIVGKGDMAIGGTSPDATTTVKGVVKLTGDLGGTADLPTTPTALHKTGNESWTGQKSAANSDGSPATVLQLINNFSTNTNGTTFDLKSISGSNSILMGLDLQSSVGGKGLLIKNTTASTVVPITVQNNLTDVFTVGKLGDITGKSFIKTGGTASQFLKADGSVDSNVYTNDANVIHKTGDESKSGFLTLNTGLKLDSSFISWLGSPAKPTGSGAATITAIGNDIAIASGSSSRQFATFKTDLLSTAQTYSFPNNSGVIALLSDIPTNALAGTSGSYTATVSEITNVSINGIGRMSNYIKVGNVVSVQANVNLNITASSTLSRFRISLPINIAGSATNFYCGQGTIFTTTAGTAAYPCQVYLNGGTEAIVQFNSEIGTGPRDVSFNFQYDITKSN